MVPLHQHNNVLASFHALAQKTANAPRANVRYIDVWVTHDFPEIYSSRKPMHNELTHRASVASDSLVISPLKPSVTTRYRNTSNVQRHTGLTYRF